MDRPIGRMGIGVLAIAVAAASWAVALHSLPVHRAMSARAEAAMQPPNAAAAAQALPNLPVPPIGADPFMYGGQQATLAYAQQWAGYPIPIPSGDGVTRADISAVWIGQADTHPSGNDREVVLDFADLGIREYVDELQVTQSQDARAVMERFQNQFPRQTRYSVLHLSGGWGVAGATAGEVWTHGLKVVFKVAGPANVPHTNSQVGGRLNLTKVMGSLRGI